MCEFRVPASESWSSRRLLAIVFAWPRLRGATHEYHLALVLNTQQTNFSLKDQRLRANERERERKLADKSTSTRTNWTRESEGERALSAMEISRGRLRCRSAGRRVSPAGATNALTGCCGCCYRCLCYIYAVDVEGNDIFGRIYVKRRARLLDTAQTLSKVIRPACVLSPACVSVNRARARLLSIDRQGCRWPSYSAASSALAYLDVRS